VGLGVWVTVAGRDVGEDAPAVPVSMTEAI
jgi:hypothetical protein